MEVGKKRIIGIIVFCSVLSFCICACRLKQSIEVSLPEESDDAVLMGEQIVIENTTVDREAVFRLLFGIEEEEADSYIPEHYTNTNMFLKDCMELVLNIDYIDFLDNTDGMAFSYMTMMRSSYQNDYLGSLMRTIYPEENLDSCTKEEAIDICAPYAEALGYANADVSVYAMTVDCLRAESEEMGGVSAPGSDYPYVSKEEVWAAEAEGDEKKLEQLSELFKRAETRQASWEKEHEAMLLIYRPYVNGLIMDSMTQMLRIIYVPKVNKIVYISGETAVECKEISKTQELITKEQAFSSMMLTLGIESDQVTFEGVSLVYSIRHSQGGKLKEVRTSNPCWRIDYTLEDKEKYDPNGCGTMLIDAFDGKVSIYID